MENSGLMGGFYRLSVWISKFAYVNLLWVTFTLVGLVILGFYPATAAMFAVLRKWIMGDTDVPVFKTFWQSYKQEFVKSNLLGLILTVIGVILIFDLKFFQASENLILSSLFIPLLLVTFLFLLVLLYIFPVFVHFDIKLLQVLKNSFLIMVMNPLITIFMLVSLGALYYILIYVPGLIMFFSGSVAGYIIMFFAYRGILKAQERQEKANNKK
ncbi:YesL family protein [Litchfieldia alkalitelluris]|uniref:YesL family protein n=1 Tax=Litchfieldia alkalitelluris TaxID=304268 RepID=UPI001F1F9470|nr:YesL family protein [Litchfieldia alkalitelluris]